MSLETEINKLAGKQLSEAEMSEAIYNLTGFLNSVIKIYNGLTEEEKNKEVPRLKSKYKPYLIID